MKNIEITIREETSRKLGLNNNPNFVRFLKTAIEMFCEYNFTDASYVIFKLLYEDDKDTHNKILKKFGFTLYSEDSFDPCVEYLFIEEDAVHPIAEEMQFQYIEFYPNFLRVKSYPSCEDELNALKTLLEKHPLLLYRAVESVWYCHKDSAVTQSCVDLLLSEKTASQEKGLEKLNHNHKHQQLLLPYAKEIGSFLKAMHQEFHEKSQEKQRIIAAQEELNALNTPFAPLAKLLDTVPAKAESLPNAVPTPKVAPATAVATSTKQTGKRAVNTSLITEYSVSQELSKFLDNKDALTFTIPNADKFWEQMAKLRGLGIDLNFLVDKLQIVLDVLSAHENFETATDSLTHADHEHSAAMELYAVNRDRENLQRFVKAAGTYQEAKEMHQTALSNFVESCNIFEKAVAKT